MSDVLLIGGPKDGQRVPLDGQCFVVRGILPRKTFKETGRYLWAYNEAGDLIGQWNPSENPPMSDIQKRIELERDLANAELVRKRMELLDRTVSELGMLKAPEDFIGFYDLNLPNAPDSLHIDCRAMTAADLRALADALEPPQERQAYGMFWRGTVKETEAAFREEVRREWNKIKDAKDGPLTVIYDDFTNFEAVAQERERAIGLLMERIEQVKLWNVGEKFEQEDFINELRHMADLIQRGCAPDRASADLPQEKGVTDCPMSTSERADRLNRRAKTIQLVNADGTLGDLVKCGGLPAEEPITPDALSRSFHEEQGRIQSSIGYSGPPIDQNQCGVGQGWFLSSVGDASDWDFAKPAPDDDLPQPDQVIKTD